MFGDWMLDETKIKIWQNIQRDIDKMNEMFERAKEFCTYKTLAGGIKGQ